MRSIVLFLESLPPMQPTIPLPAAPIKPQLPPKLLNYMKKDPEFANEVQANLKNYETMAILRTKNIIKY
jgi:hypothetical protein